MTQSTPKPKVTYYTENIYSVNYWLRKRDDDGFRVRAWMHFTERREQLGTDGPYAGEYTVADVATLNPDATISVDSRATSVFPSYGDTNGSAFLSEQEARERYPALVAFVDTYQRP